MTLYLSLNILKQIARALVYLHTSDIDNNDISPSFLQNIEYYNIEFLRDDTSRIKIEKSEVYIGKYNERYVAIKELPVIASTKQFQIK